MAGMGPPPKRRSEQRKPNRNLNKLERVLPPAGRPGDPPEWPFARPSEEELAVWMGLWATPQAVAWEQLGWVRVVARYVRDLLKAEQPRAAATIKSEVRQMEDRLGLSPLAMLRLRWEIGETEPAKERSGKGATVMRLRAIDSA